eukprot:TRINITY_DN62977_c0_g1_i1.p1 TRINITY_DN62977_c0_g1~~TRINITY_DN62977_c0_g1_i1.p1  ORF type:complete len:529 (-),score=73.56 TRINITY_DN62977_c0_g1_i1:136-1722(-)
MAFGHLAPLLAVFGGAIATGMQRTLFPERVNFTPEIEPQVLMYDTDRMASFFPPTDTEQGKESLRITNIGEYSMASPEVAKQISQTILSYFDSTANLTLTEACSNMGGNTINFARHFAKVQAVEFLPVHCDILKNNLAQYVHAKAKVEVHCADFLDMMDELQQDVIYFDPPWDRKVYPNSKSGSVDLYLDNVHLGNIVNALLQKVQLAAIWVPYNFNFHAFMDKVQSKSFHTHKTLFNDSQKSDKDMVSYLLVVHGRGQTSHMDHGIGDYYNADVYGQVNNECWYTKYGYLPSVIHYLAPLANGKAIKDFGSARGDISLSIMNGTGASSLVGISLFPEEVEAARKLAEANMLTQKASFIQHDCFVVRQFGAQASVTYSLWMLNNAKTHAMFIRMCQTMLVNTEPGGTGLILVQVANSDFFEASTSKDFEISNLQSLHDNTGKAVGVIVDKLLTYGRRQVHFRDWCYPKAMVVDLMHQAGWVNVRMVPTLPLATDEFGDPLEAAERIDRAHYTIFMAEKPKLMNTNQEL